MNRVLLTGATGFIGSNCVPLLLDAGYEVHGVVPEGVELGDERARWHVANLLDRRQVHRLLDDVRPSHLLHLAWFVAPGDFWKSPENMEWLQSGLDLTEAFVDAGGLRSVMAGTCAEYAASIDPLVEGVSPLRPSTLYGACKNALHVASSAYLDARGVSNAWAHVFYLYGPRENPSRLVPSVIRSLLAGDSFRCTNPRDVRDFLHVEDVASGFVDLLTSETRGDINIASGEPVSIQELVASIAGRIGRSELVSCEDNPVSTRTVGDATRLLNEVGWRPKRRREDGLEATIDWWKEEGRCV